MELKNRARLLVVGSVCIAVLLIIGLSIALQHPLYTAQSRLTTTYNTPFASRYWIAALFNNTQGTELAFFNFAFRYNNQSFGPVITTLSFGPELSNSINLDSVKLTFTSDGPLSWPDIGIRVPTNGFTPTQVSRTDVQKVTISYQNMGFYGTGTETFDMWFGVTVVTGSYINHSVSLTVDVTGHNPGSMLIGQSYTAEAIFRIVAQPNGLLYVPDTTY